MSGPPAPPLSGRRILVTRAAEQAGEFSGLLRARGAEVLQVSLIRFEPPGSWEAADRAVADLARYSLILFTSANAVKFFLRRLEEKGRKPSALANSILAAVGPKTAAALRRRGLAVQVVPEKYVAEGLLSALKRKSVAGTEILIPRAQEAREVLVEELKRRGARVTVAPVYRTVRADENREALISALEREVDMVTFTASSTVRHFMDLLGPRAPALMRGVRVACIGAVTAGTATERGLRPDVVPERSTIPDLAKAVSEFFLTQPPASSRRR